MNESILRALMRLFAIIANVNIDGVSNRARNIVEAYLKLQLTQDLVDEYLLLFDEYLRVHHQGSKTDSDKVKKRTSLNSVKVLMICNEINEELQQKEKVIVLVRLFEFIGEDEFVTDRELDFIKTVAETFNIFEVEYQNIKGFVIGKINEMANHNKLLVIDADENLEKGIGNEEHTQNHVTLKNHITEKHLTGQIFILHVESTNTFLFKTTGDDTIYLNSHNIVPQRTYVFDNGAVIKSPKISPIYYSDISSKFFHSSSNEKLLFQAKDIEFQFKNSENGIHNFTFSEESGTLIGIMGGSGVGKSTLLNVFNGNLKPQSGAITINGYELHNEHDKDKLKGVIGYVPQDDLLIDELSVFQNLYYNAKLCFRDFTEREIIKAVVRVLVDLDLIEIKHLTVGDPLNKFISGGQRKRLNIGLELIREPSILIVDEPTSGLSSMDSEMVMSLLKEQTIKGKLVLVNIHQPSSDIFKLFDKILVMDRGGYPVYYGNPIDAVVYFKTISNHVNAVESECVTCGNVNPEQILQILEAKMVNEYGKFTRNRKISPKEWYTFYKEKIESVRKFKPVEKNELPKNFFKVPSRLKQFWIFSIRNLLSKLTNKQYLLINFLEAPLLSLILAYFTKYTYGNATNTHAYIFSENENIPAYLFMSVIVALFLGLTVSAEEIIRDRRILMRESFLNLSKFSYLNSKILILFILSAIQMLSFILVGNTILEIEGMTFKYWMILFSTAACANMIGLNISASLNSVVNIYIMIPFILVPQLLFSGVIVNFDKIHKQFASVEYVPIIGDIMTSRWAYEALAVTQFRYNKYETNFFAVDKEFSMANYRFMCLLPELENKLNESKRIIDAKGDKKLLEKNLQILQYHFTILEVESKIKFQMNNQLVVEKFNEEAYNQTYQFVEKLKSYYESKQTKAIQKKDKIISDLKKSKKDDLVIEKLKNTHYNKRLADLVLNKNEINTFKESDGKLEQIKDPVFKSPKATHGRAHFYAPTKRIGKYEIETRWFNVIFIWFTSFMFYLSLIFDWFRKLFDLLGSLGSLFKLRKPKQHA